MESQRATYQDLRISTWRPALAGELVSDLEPSRPRIRNQSAADVPGAVPLLSAMDCFGCVDWYAYGPAAPAICNPSRCQQTHTDLGSRRNRRDHS